VNLVVCFPATNDIEFFEVCSSIDQILDLVAARRRLRREQEQNIESEQQRPREQLRQELEQKQPEHSKQNMFILSEFFPDIYKQIKTQKDEIASLRDQLMAKENVKKDHAEDILAKQLGIEPNRLFDNVVGLFQHAIATYGQLRRGTRDKQVILSLFVHFGVKV
jgi:hypothetical protein